MISTSAFYNVHWQQFGAFRHIVKEDDLLKFQVNIKLEKIGDLKVAWYQMGWTMVHRGWKMVIFLAHFGLISTSRALFKYHSLPGQVVTDQNL